MERKCYPDVCVRIQQLGCSYGGCDISVARHHNGGIAGAPTQDFEELARDRNVRLFLFMRAIRKANGRKGQREPTAKRLNLDMHLAQILHPFLLLEVGESDLDTRRLQSRNKGPMPSDNVGLLRFKMFGEGREVVDTVECMPGSKRALENRLAEAV